TRVHVANAVFPMYFEGLPLVWLGSAADAESIDRLERLAVSSELLRLRADLVGGIGLHADSRVAAPALVRLLKDERHDDELRAQAAIWLEHHPTTEGVAALSSTSRTDRSSNVR